MKPKLLLGSAAFAGGLFFSSLPSHAAFMGCGTPSSPSTMASGTVADLISGFECQVGDKLYSLFETDLPSGADVSIAENSGTQHTFTVGSAGTLGGGSYLRYTITALAMPGYSLKTFQTDILGGVGSNNATDNVTWTNTVDIMPIALSLTPGPSMSGIRNFISSPLTSTSRVSHELTNTDTLTGITDTVTQTPGPLPLLGAGAAFGFSRKLRHRVKSAI